MLNKFNIKPLLKHVLDICSNTRTEKRNIVKKIQYKTFNSKSIF